MLALGNVNEIMFVECRSSASYSSDSDRELHAVSSYDQRLHMPAGSHHLMSLNSCDMPLGSLAQTLYELSILHIAALRSPNSETVCA